MNTVLKKILSVFLAVAMLVSISPAYAANIAEGTNGKDIYLNITFTSDEGGENPVTEVNAGDKFYTWVNFSNNPTVKKNSIQSYDLFIGYDSDKIGFNEEVEEGEEESVKVIRGLTEPTFNGTYDDGVIYAGWANENGIKNGSKIAAAGNLFVIINVAKTNLLARDLAEIMFIREVTSGETSQTTMMLDGNDTTFNLVLASDRIEMGEVSGEIYSDATAASIKNMLSSFTYINKDDTSTEFDSTDAEWDDLIIELPAAGLKVGKNKLIAVYNDCVCEFEITVLDRIESIAITTAPTKTTYNAFETFDKTGMVVTATYESGNTEDVTEQCTVDTTTKLTVADKNWQVSFRGKTATQAITVNPVKIEKPVVDTAVKEYNAAEQSISYAVAVDAANVTVSGDVKGKNAGTYTAVAKLKDKTNTAWADGTTADVSLSWTIEKANITSGMANLTKKYNTKYSELPVTASVTGKNSETVSANIKWYTDADCTQAATSSAQIADANAVGQTKTLYYKASGMANYNDYKGAVAVSIIDKETAVISVDTLPSGWSRVNDTKAEATYSTAGYTIDNAMFIAKSASGSTLTSGTKTVAIKKDGQTVDKITDVGTYVVTVTYEDNDYKGTQEFTAVVNPKSIVGFTVKIKNISGRREVDTSEESPLEFEYVADEIAPEVASVEGLTANDYAVDLNVDGTTHKATNVSDSVHKIAVVGKGNYTGTTYGYWAIIPAPLKASTSVATIADKVYNGQTDDAVITSIAFDGLKGSDALVKDVDYTISQADYESADVGEHLVRAFIELTDTQLAKNYEIIGAVFEGTGKITPAAAPTLTASAVQTLLSSAIVNGSKDYTFNLANIISGIPADAGDVTYALKTEGSFVKKNGAGVDGSTLKVTVATPQAADATDSVVVTVSSKNYKDADVTVNFIFKNKTTVNVSLDDVTATYGEAYAVNGKYANQPSSGYTWTYTYEGIEGTDYHASSTKPINAGKYKVTASYDDNTPDTANPDIPGHVGEATATLTINKKALTITDGDYAVTKVYDGETTSGIATGSLAVDGKVGSDNVSIDMTDATVGAYADAKVGTYTVEISGLKLAGDAKDNYTIPNTYSFKKAKITKNLQAALTINGAADDIIEEYSIAGYTITVAGGNGEGAYKLQSSDANILSLTADGENSWKATAKKVGSVTLTATKQGDDNYEAAAPVSVTFTITEKEIADSDFTVDVADKIYTGSEIKPSVTSTLKAEDYSVAYGDNTNVGTATITITGKGNYKGELTKEFAISAKAINDNEFAVSGIMTAYTYNGSAIKPNVSVKWNNITLTAEDYSVAYANNTNVGEATITITGSGNYSGTITKTFAIKPAAYTGTVTITSSDEVVNQGTVLTANAPDGDVLSYQWKRNGTDIENATSSTYTVGLDDAGADITVAVTSTGNYAGTLTSDRVTVGKAVLKANIEIVGTTELTASITDAPDAENYTIVWLRNGVAISGASAETYVIGDDDKGCSISVKIVAKGDTYAGEVLSSNSVDVPATAPSFGNAPTATAKDKAALVEFAAKANGSAILNYQIMVDGEIVATIDGTQTSYTVEGLENGKEYTIKVVAINGIGSTESEEVKVTPKSTGGGGGGGGGGGSSKPADKPDDKPADEPATPDDEPSAGELDSIEEKFVDVIASNWYGPAINFVLSTNIMQGMSANTFAPNATLTRAQLAQILYNLAGKPAISGGNHFKDVAGGAWYNDAITWAYSNGIVYGKTADAFAPNENITREALAVMLYRYVGDKAGSSEITAPDAGHVSDWAKEALAWATAAGIVNGDSKGNITPKGIATRAQVAQMFYNYLSK